MGLPQQLEGFIKKCWDFMENPIEMDDHWGYPHGHGKPLVDGSRGRLSGEASGEALGAAGTLGRAPQARMTQFLERPFLKKPSKVQLLLTFLWFFPGLV